MSAAGEACWKREGVGGDRSCARLAEHTHCRNCDAWRDEAARVMQRALPEDYRREWARHFAQPEEEPAAADIASLVFRVGPEWLALPAPLAITVAEQTPVHRIPHRGGPALQGIVNIRGQLYPCFSLAGLLGIDGATPAPAAGRRVYPRLLALRLPQQDCALPVDEIHGIHRHAAHDLQPVPAMGRELQRHVTAVLRIGAMAVGCLDPERLGRQLTGLLR